MTSTQQRFQRQAGFTLVELAIVMIIIGLLIAGVLKGQELIGNARVTATVAQIKAIDAGVSTFKDTYQGLPGDLINPTARLPNCTGDPCKNPGNGDGKLANIPGAVPATKTEGDNFFVDLSVANLLTGISADGQLLAGHDFLQAKIDSSVIFAGSSTAPASDLVAAVGTTGSSSGLYLVMVGSIATPASTNVGMTPSQAGRIDAKLDDGVPGTGSVVGIGAASSSGCASSNTATGVYNSNLTSTLCGVYVRIQG